VELSPQYLLQILLHCGKTLSANRIGPTSGKLTRPSRSTMRYRRCDTPPQKSTDNSVARPYDIIRADRKIHRDELRIPRPILNTSAPNRLGVAGRVTACTYIS